MPHITAAISLTDGLTTPVARSFVPVKLGMDACRFSYKLSPLKFGWVNLDVKWSDSTPKRPTVRQEVGIEFPVVRTVNTVATKIATGRAFTTFIIPDEMTEDEVRDLRMFQITALQNSNIALGVTSREPLWG